MKRWDLRDWVEFLALVLAIVGASRFLAGCGGEAIETMPTGASDAPAAECETLEPFVEFSGEAGCYVVPDEPRLSFSHYWSTADCSIQNNGVELHSFTLWDVLEPGTLTVEGCPYSFRLVLADDWENWPESEAGAGGAK